MTQSGISQHLRKLEEFLGVALIQRQGRQFTPTEAGRKLYGEAHEIVESLSTLSQRLGEDPVYEGLVRILSPGSVGLKLYPRFLKIQQGHPKLIIDYRFAPNRDVERSLLEYRCDMGLMTSPSALDEIASQPVASEALILVTPVAIKNTDWSTLLKLGYVGHPDGAYHASLLLGANYLEFQHVDMFALRGFSNQISLILEPVSLGLGFTVLPEHAVNAFDRPELIRSHRLETPVSETLFLATRRHRALPARVKNLIAMAREWL